MKILQINKLYCPIIGGVEKVVQNIAESFNQQNNIVVDVLACQKKGKREITTINNITVYRAASLGRVFSMPFSLDFFRLFLKIRKDYNAILIHHPFPLAFLILPFIKNKNIFIWYHSDIVRQRFIKHLFTPFICYGLRKAKKIFVSNNNLKNNSTTLSKYKNKCEVIYFGVDINSPINEAENTSKASNIKQKYPAPLILSVGRLVPYKGFKYLIRAMETVDGQLLIIGQGPLKDRLNKLINGRKLNHKVSIIDPVDNLIPFYQACDLFVLPSCQNNEAFGIVQIEAMAQGKPVINTNLPTGVPEISLDGVSGLTVKRKSHLALAQGINRIISNKELRDELGRGARNRVEQIFNQKTFIERLRYFLTR